MRHRGLPPRRRAAATTTASRLHAVTSSTAAHVIAVVPRGVRVRPRSSRIRASTGNAVMLIAMPRKSAKGTNRTPGGREIPVETEGEHDAEEVRHHDARVAHDDRRMRPIPQRLDVELEPDQEEKQEHSDLRENLEAPRSRTAREQERGNPRCNRAEQARPEQESPPRSLRSPPADASAQTPRRAGAPARRSSSTAREAAGAAPRGVRRSPPQPSRPESPAAARPRRRPPPAGAWPGTVRGSARPPARRRSRRRTPGASGRSRSEPCACLRRKRAVPRRPNLAANSPEANFGSPYDLRPTTYLLAKPIRPRYASFTFGFAATSAEVPSSDTVPVSRT